MWEPVSYADRSGYLGVGLAAAALGATAALLLDPRSGRRRRALMRDQVARRAHQVQEFIGKAGRDARQRAHGFYSEQTSRLRPDRGDDHVIAERVRAALGRLTSHPGPIYVTCSNAAVRLRGDVLQREEAAVVHGVGRVRGVREVVNELRAHANAGHVSALQGAGVQPAPGRFEYLQTNWSPAPRLFAGAAALALVAAGMARRSPVAAVCGAALLARALWNRPLTHLIGVRARDTDGVEVHKTIEVYAEVDEVYACWRDPECFPRFMRRVRSVEKLDDAHYRWTVDGPAG
ncbi:MAG TPA: SRPBCC family protein, partial [Steroidobacter sp.]|nr:SRPBCC family protein [Steroidobacter sp.]